MISRWIAGLHEPQFVPADNAAPTASVVISRWFVMALVNVMVPMSKQLQTIAPRSGAGVAERPASSSVALASEIPS